MKIPTYVLGFAFNEDKSKVLLIKKNRPQWQAGFFNGIGGKIEDFDASTIDALIREFEEETGLKTTVHQWNQYATVQSQHFHVTVYWTTLKSFEGFKSITDEIVYEVNVADLFQEQFRSCLSNLIWLIPMALEKDSKYIKSETSYSS